MTRETLSRFAGLGVLAALVLAVALLPVQEPLFGAVAWIRDRGPVGVLVFAALYSVAPVLMVPGSVLTLGAGFVWGPVLGAAIAIPSATVGATFAFFLGRHLLRDTVARRVARHPRLAALDRATRAESLLFVLLLRLSPAVPFVLLNYAMGLTSVRPGPYVMGTVVGMIPGAFLFAYVGSTVSRAAQLDTSLVGAGDAGAALYWGGLLATALAVMLVTRVARRVLDRRMPEGGPV